MKTSGLEQGGTILYPFHCSRPRDENHVHIAVSCAGVFETKDGGKSWAPCNTGLVAAYLPNPQRGSLPRPHSCYFAVPS